jgi:ATP-binding cassette subfamily B multidrug efflux pump
MSDRSQTPARPSGPPARGPGHMMMGMTPPAKSKDFRGSFGRLVARLRPEQAKIVLVLVLAAISVGLTILGPLILGHATNVLFEGVINKQLPAGSTQQQVLDMLRSTGRGQIAAVLSNMHLAPGQGVRYGDLARILLTLVGVYVLSAVFGWGQAYIMAGVAQRTMYRLREDVDRKLARLPLQYFDGHAHGDLLSRVTNDIDNIANSLQQTLTQLITAALTIVGVLIMMLTISPMLALISLIAVPVSIGITIVIAKRAQKQFGAQWKRTGDVDGYIEEMFSGHAIVKVFGKQRPAIEHFDELNQGLFESSFRAQFISGIIQPSMMFISNLNYVLIAVIGGVRVADGTLSLGAVVAFIQYARMFTQPITQTASIMNVLQSAVASAERVFELLDEPEEDADPAEPAVLRDTHGHIALTDVSFRYEESTPLIEGLVLEVPAGETVAIVGPTGAGKTTLVNLLMRFYEIDAGRISIDDIDTRQMTRDGLRRLFGMVLQDPWLFRGTIRDNIAYGREGATEDEIHAAARAARLDHFVATLPEGYDTVIDDEASNVSQGEKQLLTIARAFLADPQILILDEATSSVDTRTEVLIQEGMTALMHERTSFVIAHRLSTVRGAHTILVMDHGAIIEQGDHETLIARRGFYYDLYHSQFVGALEEEEAS